MGGGSAAIISVDIDFPRITANAGKTLYVGDENIESDGSAGGMSMKPGDKYSYSISDKNKVWVVSSAVNATVNYNYFRTT